MVTNSEAYFLLSGIGFVGILVALLVTFFGQQEMISPPPEQ
jgi:hypothetical protein